MKLSVYKMFLIKIAFVVLGMASLYGLLGVLSAKAEEYRVTGESSTDARVKTPVMNARVENRVETNASIRTAEQIRLEAMRKQIADKQNQNRQEVKLIRASSTDLFKRKEGEREDMRKDMAKKMERRIFEIRKMSLVKILTTSINNLQNISNRIASRIAKIEATGRNVADIRALLAIADDKLVQAKADVAAFQALTVSGSGATTNTSASSTVEIDLERPRALGDAAIKSVKAAREAFRQVIVAIAHSMGVGVNATSTTDIR